MADALDFLETAITDHILGSTAYPAPTNVYVKLHIGDPGEDGTANPAAETTRVLVTFGAATSPGGVAANDIDVTWTGVSTTETYSHYTIHDDLTAGNGLLKGTLTAPVAVTAGQNFTIATGNLTVTTA